MNDSPRWFVSSKFANMRMAAILMFPLLLLVIDLNAQDWKLKRSEEGIKVYTKPNPSSGFESFKAVMELDAPASDMVYFLKHIDKHPEAFPDTRELKILARPNDSTQIQYSLTDAPWPVSDRDGIYRLVFHTNRKTGVTTSKGVAIPDYLPPKDDVVRIQQSTSYWIITPKGPDKCELQYIVHAEPGGNIPEWLANSAAVDVPYDTFINIRKAMMKKKNAKR